jgi:hypothetical protein
MGATLLLTAPDLRAQVPNPAPGADRDPLRVELTTRGVYSGISPRATVQLNRPAYVALFEIQPGVGATLLYPHDPDDQRRHATGGHTVRLDGLQMYLRRRLMYWHLGYRLPQAPFDLRSHLVAVASEHPLDVERLRSDRIFRASYGADSPERVTTALLADVVSGVRGTDWSASRASFTKWLARSPTLAHLGGLDVPFLVTQRDLLFFGFPFPGVGLSTFSCRHALAGALYRSRLGPGWLYSGCYHRSRPVLAWQVRRDVQSPDPAPEALPRDVREALERVADARSELPAGRDGSRWRRIEAVGEALQRRGVGVDTDRIRELRRRGESRAWRSWQRELHRHLGSRSRAGDRRRPAGASRAGSFRDRGDFGRSIRRGGDLGGRSVRRGASSFGRSHLQNGGRSLRGTRPAVDRSRGSGVRSRTDRGSRPPRKAEGGG